MPNSRFLKSINLFDENININQVFLDIARPIGSTYTQYPGQESPETLFNIEGSLVSTWEVVKYGGAFFRTEGTNAKDFLSLMPATTSDGKVFTVDLSLLPSEEERNKMKMGTNFNIGDPVAIGGEYRTVTRVNTGGGVWVSIPQTSWTNIAGFEVDSAFTGPGDGYISITNVTVLQNDQNKSHNHPMPHTHTRGTMEITGKDAIAWSGKHNGAINNGNRRTGALSDELWTNQPPNRWGNDVASGGEELVPVGIAFKASLGWTGNTSQPTNDNTSNSGGTEGRPFNSTYRIWLRTA